MKHYKPEYAKGEILVCFLGNSSTEFVQTIAELMGHKLKDEEYEFGDSYIIQTRHGSEDKACKDFQTLSIKGHRLVDWAARSDMKLEKRFRDLGSLVEMAESLRDDPEQEKMDYDKKLDEIINYVSSLKESK